MIQFEADSRENLILYIQSSLEKQEEKKNDQNPHGF